MQELIPEEARELAARAAEAAFWSSVTDWQFRLYYIAFAVCAGLLLFFCLLAKGSRFRWPMGQGGLIGLLALCCVSQQVNLDERRGFIADQNKRYEKAISALAAHKDKEEALRAEYMYLPAGNSLAYMTLDNTSLAADYLWLTSMQYVSNSFRRGEKFELLLRIYDELLQLDPHWTQAAINAGKVLSALEPDRYAVERFYSKAIVLNPDNLDLPYETGRLFVVPPLDPGLRKDYSRHAVGWFEEDLARLRKAQERHPSAQISDGIKALQDMTGRLALESGPGFYEVGAELLWRRATDRKYPTAMRMAAARDFLCADSLVLVYRLQEAAERHKQARGAYPADLRQLLRELKGRPYPQLDSQGEPVDAYGLPLVYDPATGKAASKGVQARRAIISASVINSLIGVYRGAHSGAPPSNLKHLHDFLVEYYKASYNRLGPAVTDALGMDLNTTLSPLGRPWEYDAQEGEVKLPEVCDPNTLFRNAGRIVEGE